MTDEKTDEKTQDMRAYAISIAFGATACLIYAAFSQHWLVNAQANVMFGLRSYSECYVSPCHSSSNAAFVEMVKAESPRSAALVSDAFSPMGWATTMLCLLTAFGLFAAAVLAIAKRRPTLPIAPSTIAILAAMAGLITGCIFVATKPGEPGMVGIGLAFWAFGLGMVGAIAGAQMLAKVNRPPDPDLMDGAMNPDQF